MKEQETIGKNVERSGDEGSQRKKDSGLEDQSEVEYIEKEKAEWEKDMNKESYEITSVISARKLEQTGYPNRIGDKILMEILGWK